MVNNIKLLLYCTKSNKKLFYDVVSQKYMYGLDGKKDKFNSLNGKIVAECDYEIEEIEPYQYQVNSYEGQTGYKTKALVFEELLKRSCLTFEKIDKYLYCDIGHAIHLKNLHIFDRPRNLSCYSTYIKEIVNTWWFYLNHKKAKQLEKAPQNMMYCYGNNTGEKYILISIHPEWLAKILNGEKTIEVRKKVLKEMINNA